MKTLGAREVQTGQKKCLVTQKMGQEKKKKSQTEAHGDKGTEKTHQATQFKEDL